MFRYCRTKATREILIFFSCIIYLLFFFLFVCKMCLFIIEDDNMLQCSNDNVRVHATPSTLLSSICTHYILVYDKRYP